LKPPRFTYHAPGTLDEALELLAARPNARPLAGGQSLMPMLNFRLAAPEHLVDLNRVEALAFIREENDAIVIGAMTRQRDIERSELVAQRLPLITEAIRMVGHRPTRNRGTLGGSLAHLDPAAELPAVAMALDAQIGVRSRRGARILPMAHFGTGLLSTALDPDELVTEVRFPIWPSGHGHAFEEFARRHGDFAIVSVAALVHADRVSITLGGVAPVPLRATSAEEHFARTRHITEAAALCGEIDTFADHAYPAWYRKKLAVSLTQRALERACKK
jgi:aerobic carbon-monoxide dehydrogenase medium subunit